MRGASSTGPGAEPVAVANIAEDGAGDPGPMEQGPAGEKAGRGNVSSERQELVLGPDGGENADLLL